MKRFVKLIIVALLLSLLLAACGPAEALRGGDLQKKPAPDFQLLDQNGQPADLAAWRGKAVVLTFLFTHCTDECPRIAGSLHEVAQQLGPAMNDVVFASVSVDPANDTPEAVAQFLQDHGLTGQMHYLTGSEAQLAPVWTGYFIAAQEASTSAVPAMHDVLHSSRVITIDKAGRQRSNFDSDFAPADLAHDLRALLKD